MWVRESIWTHEERGLHGAPSNHPRKVPGMPLVLLEYRNYPQNRDTLVYTQPTQPLIKHRVYTSDGEFSNRIGLAGVPELSVERKKPGSWQGCRYTASLSHLCGPALLTRFQPIITAATIRIHFSGLCAGVQFF